MQLTTISHPPTDIQTVLDNEIKEWHFHIYFLQNNEQSRAEALELRDAILSLRSQGAFVAVPLYRVNYGPIGPHTIGSYEVWCPTESFASVFSYMTLYRGDLSVLIHPLTREERKDHDTRKAWLGQPYGLDLSVLPVLSDTIPYQYPELKMGYTSDKAKPSLDERKHAGKEVDDILKDYPQAA